MDCALRVRDRHRVRPDDIVEIRCRTAEGPVPRLWEPLAAKHAPQNGYAAKFRLPYLLAVILIRGRASLAEFEDDVVRDREVLALASRIGYELDPTIDYPQQFVGHVRVRLRDGRIVEESQDHPRGGPDSPMGRDEIESKFLGNASLVMPADRASRVSASIAALDTEPNLRGLVEALALYGDPHHPASCPRGRAGVAVAPSALPAAAQDARTDAAKKEGKVVWYTSLALPTAETKVMSVVIFDLKEEGQFGAIAVLGLVMLALTFATVALVQAVLGRDVLGARE